MSPDRPPAPKTDRDGRKEPRPDPVHLDRAFLDRIDRWERAPHNRPGIDKTWVERLLRETAEHYRRATRVPR